MDPARARELLARERARIEEALAALDREGPLEGSDRVEPGDEDSEDLDQDEVDEGRRLDLRGELAAVERAEARLEAGTFGLSIESGEPIPDARLEAAADRRADRGGGGPLPAGMTADCDGVSEPLGWAVSPARFRPGPRVYSQKGINGIPMRVTRDLTGNRDRKPRRYRTLPSASADVGSLARSGPARQRSELQR